MITSFLNEFALLNYRSGVTSVQETTDNFSHNTKNYILTGVHNFQKNTDNQALIY